MQYGVCGTSKNFEAYGKSTFKAHKVKKMIKRHKSENKTFNSVVEFLTVSSVLVFILICVRISSRVILGDEWVYSLGLISAILATLLFFARKEKLGIFGKMLIRQVTKKHSKKQKLAIGAQTSLILFVGILTVFSIHMGNTEYHHLKDQVIGEFSKKEILIGSDLNVSTIQKISSQVTPSQQLESAVNLPLLTITDYKIFAVILAVSDQLFGGWVMYFWQVLLIEIAEFSVFLGIVRRISINAQKNSL